MMLPDELGSQHDTRHTPPTSDLAPAELAKIIETLEQCNGNQTRAAKLLGVSRSTLATELSIYRIPRPRK